MANSIESKESRSKLGSLGGATGKIIGAAFKTRKGKGRQGLETSRLAAKSRAEGEMTKGDQGEKAKRRRQRPFLRPHKDFGNQMEISKSVIKT